MKKKICFVQLKALAYFMPELEITPGGAERQIYLLSTQLAQHEEWDVSICVADHGQGKCLEKEGVKLWASIAMQRSRILELLTLYRTLKKIDADVYVFRTVDLGVAVAAFLVKTLGKKMLYMVANVDEANPKALKSWFGNFKSNAMAWVYKNVDALIVQTREQAEDFKAYRNIEVQAQMPNLYVKPEVEHTKLDRNIILWVGRSDPLKRPELFIELACEHPDQTFVLVSPSTSYESYSLEIKSKSAEVTNLTLLERQSQNQLIGLYQSAKLLINTSVSEGFSNAMIEALSFGVPMLTMGVNPDGILDEFGLGFSKKDREDFNTTFMTMMENPDDCCEMGQRGRVYVEQQHSPKSSLNKFLPVIQQLC